MMTVAFGRLSIVPCDVSLRRRSLEAGVLFLTTLLTILPTSRRRIIPFVAKEGPPLLPDHSTSLVSVLGVASPATGREPVQAVKCQPVREQLPSQLSNELSIQFCVKDDVKPLVRSSEATVNVKGRLKSHIQFWKDINASDYILNIIANGYSLPFSSFPPRANLRNNKSSRDHGEFVAGAIMDLVNSGAAIQVDDIPWVVNPLTVALNKKKKRLVLDLRHVNEYVILDHIKFEDWKFAQDLVIHSGFMFSFDLKSGYHHLDIHKDYQKYLGFKWEFDGIEKYFVFTVLPFGLATAGHIFTKTLRCLVSHWRSLSINIVLYLDDGICFAKDALIAKSHSAIVKTDLEKSGLVSNIEKSIWEPVQITNWLGFEIDLTLNVISVPSEKLQRILALLDSLLARPRTTARKLAAIVGKINSLHLVVGDATNIMLKYSHLAIIARNVWDFYFDLNVNVISEMKFWRDNLFIYRQKSLLLSESCSRIVYSDASSTACMYVVEVQDSVCHRSWQGNESSFSSTWRELEGVYTV